MPPTITACDEYLLLIQFGPAVLRSVPILAVDLEDASMTIIYASYLLEQMFGYDYGELRGVPLNNLIPEKYRGVHLEYFKLYQKEPKDRTMNAGVWVDALKKDGSLFKIQVALCVQEVGKRTVVIALIADVTKAYNRLVPEFQRLAESKDKGHGEAIEGS